MCLDYDKVVQESDAKLVTHNIDHHGLYNYAGFCLSLHRHYPLDRTVF